MLEYGWWFFVNYSERSYQILVRSVWHLRPACLETWNHLEKFWEKSRQLPMKSNPWPHALKYTFLPTQPQCSSYACVINGGWICKTNSDNSWQLVNTDHNKLITNPISSKNICDLMTSNTENVRLIFTIRFGVCQSTWKHVSIGRQQKPTTNCGHMERCSGWQDINRLVSNHNTQERFTCFLVRE